MSDNSEYGLLVVDDDEPIIKTMRRVLKRKGFTKVVSALSGEQGIKLLETTQTPFFLIISDQRMPGISGSEFLKKSMLLSPESRRMLITGYSKFDAIIDAVNKGEIHQYISKPWDNDDLLLRIMGELEIYKNFQERKHLYNVTQRQNAKLFDFASTQKKELQKFNQLLKVKKLILERLARDLKEAKKQAEFKELFIGLDELLSRTIIINKDTLPQAYAIAKKEVTSLVKTVSHRNKLAFFPEHIYNRAGNELTDEIFEIIDQIIENVVIKVESDLLGIGSDADTVFGIDEYRELPNFEDLAFNDGFITKDERKRAQEELAENKAESSQQFTIDKVLVHNGVLKRQDLSQISAKLAMIETRILDRKYSKILLDRNFVSKKDIDRAFKKQLNNFENKGVLTHIDDILVEYQLLSPQMQDKVTATLDGTVETKSAVDTSSQFFSKFGAFVDLGVSANGLKAWIRVPETAQGKTDISPIKKLMKKKGIKHGIITDTQIQKFLKTCTDPNEKYVVARGGPPSVGKPAQIIYHFNTESDSAGVIDEDGSINFKERGNSPFVKKGQLLAEKKPSKLPKSGMDVFGDTLLADKLDQTDDPPLEGGDNVALSEDGLKLSAAIAGRPNINFKGAVSVLESFTVTGDVDFKTGNINFNGNVIVTGVVKEGFRVECEDLTANEVNGGIIRIRGDLKVSNGIVNSDIQTQGSVQAKFLNKVTFFGYGNVMITGEIMESYIAVSGTLNNETGRITASTIAARKGMSVKQIGTEKAKDSIMKIGADDHIQWIAQKYDIKIENAQKELDVTSHQKRQHDEEINGLHVAIASQSFAQEKIFQKINFLEKEISKVEGKDDKAKVANGLNRLKTGVALADKRIKAIFQGQDILQQKFAACEQKIKTIEDEIKRFQNEKDEIISTLESEDPILELKVSEKLYAGTQIIGAQASLTLQQGFGASKFTEIDSNDRDRAKQIAHQTINL